MSQMSREDMLRELELLPVWQLRQPLPMQLKRELVVTEQLVKEQEHVALEPETIEITVAESPAPEPSIHESSISEPAPSALEASVPVAPVPQQLISQQLEVVESFEMAPVPEPVVEQVLPLRLLLSEDNSYAFLIEPYAAESDAQQTETLLKNMIRAMQASCRVDVTDTADKIFAMHTPKLMISFGEVPANELAGKTHTLDEWRHIQQDSPSLYKQTPLIVTYHPVHLLANAADKALAWRDLCSAMKLVQNL